MAEPDQRRTQLEAIMIQAAGTVLGGLVLSIVALLAGVIEATDRALIVVLISIAVAAGLVVAQRPELPITIRRLLVLAGLIVGAICGLAIERL